MQKGGLLSFEDTRMHAWKRSERVQRKKMDEMKRSPFTYQLYFCFVKVGRLFWTESAVGIHHALVCIMLIYLLGIKPLLDLGVAHAPMACMHVVDDRTRTYVRAAS